MIHVEVNHDDLAYVQAKLKWKREKAPEVLRNATNDTAVTARRLLAEHAQQRYTVKNGGFNNHVKIQPRATTAKPTAVIKVNGRPLTQPRFHTTAPKTGAKTEVIKGSGLRTIIGPKGIKAFTGRGKNGLNNLIYQREGKARTPLKSLHGPSVPKMIEKVYNGRITDEGLKARIEETYRKNLNRQIERMLMS